MVKLILKKLLIISIIISLFLPIIVYAMDSSTDTEEKKEFFYVDKTEVTQGEEITMTLDMSLINYNDFEFKLISNIRLEEIISDEEEIDTNIEDNEFSIISNKSNISMEKISLHYKIPEDMEIGTKITLLGKIKENILKNEEITDDKVSKEEIIEEEIETESQDKESEEHIIEKVAEVEEVQEGETIEKVPENEEVQENEAIEKVPEDELVQENKEQEVTITITVVEKAPNEQDVEEGKDNKNDENNNEENNVQKDEDQSQTQNQNQMTSVNKTQVQTSKTSGNISNSLSSKETIKYNGESNNYLSGLTVSGYDLTPSFSKTNSTYFINVSDDVTSVEIQAEAEDKNATVKVYGNENLQEGDNKVLISVTAENGDVRTYRVYVVK